MPFSGTRRGEVSRRTGLQVRFARGAWRPFAVACLAAVAIVAATPWFGGVIRGAETRPSGDGLLARLVETPGVSGDEAAVRQVVAGALPKWANPKIDDIGNLIATIGSGRPHVLLVASIDEDGFTVTGITADGYLRLSRYTSGIQHRFFEQYHYSQPVVVRTDAGKMVPGVVASTSQHLGGPQVLSRAIRTIDDLYVDMGASSQADAQALGVQVLDNVALATRLQPLAHSRTAGVVTQARAHACALVELLARRTESPAVTGTLTVAWTAQGAYRGRGLARLAREIEPDRIVLLDRAVVSQEASPRGAFGDLGRGPLVRQGDSVGDAAARAGINVQTVTMPAPGTPWPPAKVSVLAVPVLFAQTPVETTDARDREALVRLLEEIARLPAVAHVPAPSTPTRSEPAARPATVAAQGAARPSFFSILRPLIEADGVSPHEASVVDVVRRLLPPWAKPEVDARGNLTVSFGQGKTSIVFVAHVDEIGYEVAAIRDDGTATVRKRGGLMDAMYEARPMMVRTARGLVPAVMAPRMRYATATEAFPAADDLFVYFGTDTREETAGLGVTAGDTFTVPKTFTRLAGQRAAGRSMDDRVGDAALISALWQIDPARVANRVTFAWVGGEETGLVGSGFLAGRVKPDYAFAVDTLPTSDSPVDNPRMAYLKLGSGAVIRGIDSLSMAPKVVIRQLAALAKARGIPASLGANNGGTDAASFVLHGVPTAGLSWPGRYSHSTVEVVDARDADALARLVVAVAETFPGGGGRH